MASRSRWPSQCYIFMILTIFRTGKSGHFLHWPDHWLIGSPLPKDCCLPCLHYCHLVPVLVRHGGRSMLPWLHSVYARLLLLSSINSLTGSVLKNCSTTTSIGTSLPWGRDCFVDVNAGHSLHRCQAVSISSSRQHWHVWSMSFFHLLIWWPNRPWPVMARKMTPKFFLDIFFIYFILFGLTTWIKFFAAPYGSAI